MPNKKNKRKSKVPDEFDQLNSLRDISRNQTCLISIDELTEMSPLGEGFYANVVLGEWTRPNMKRKTKKLKENLECDQESLIYALIAHSSSIIHNRNKEFVAIKSIKEAVIEDHLEDILREADTMIRLIHNNIIRLYGISLVTTKYPMGIKLVTEYAPLGSLLKVLQEHKVEFIQVKRLWKFAGQIAVGMEYLAKQGLVHRDLAARNILVVEPELVRISDFGLAKALDHGQSITRGKQFPLAWCSPEVLKAEPFSYKSDVWSYAVLLWEMFSFGKVPWEGYTAVELMRIYTTQPDRRLEQPKACPHGLYGLVMNCWETDSAQRPDFTEIHSAIMTLEPQTGIAKEDLWVATEGRLAFKRHSTVTVISKSDVMMWTGQNEDGEVGLFDHRCLKFDKEPSQKNSKHNMKKDFSRMIISQPYNPIHKPMADVLDELHIPEDHPIRATLRKSKKKVVQAVKVREERVNSLPRPEPIGAGMHQEDPANGYVRMTDGNGQHPDNDKPSRIEQPNHRAEISVDGTHANSRENATDDRDVLERLYENRQMVQGDLRDTRLRSRQRQASALPPEIPERPDMTSKVPYSHRTVANTGTRKRPVPTPRKKRIVKTQSTPLGMHQGVKPWNDVNSDRDPMGTRSEGEDVSENSNSDSEPEHPSLVPLIELSSSASRMKNKFSHTEYECLWEGNYGGDISGPEHSRDFGEAEEVVKVNSSADNKGYGAVLIIDTVEPARNTAITEQTDQMGRAGQAGQGNVSSFDNDEYYFHGIRNENGKMERSLQGTSQQRQESLENGTRDEPIYRNTLEPIYGNTVDEVRTEPIYGNTDDGVLDSSVKSMYVNSGAELAASGLNIIDAEHYYENANTLRRSEIPQEGDEPTLPKKDILSRDPYQGGLSTLPRPLLPTPCGNEACQTLLPKHGAWELGSNQYQFQTGMSSPLNPAETYGSETRHPYPYPSPVSAQASDVRTNVRNDVQAVPTKEPLYDYPFHVPPPPVIDSKIINQPPPSAGFGADSATVPGTGLAGFPTVPGTALAGSSTVPGTPCRTHPMDVESQTPDVQTKTKRISCHELGTVYGEEINRKLREIRQEVPEMLWNECYNVLMRYKGDEEIVLKILKVCNLTGVDESTAKFHLGHCDWDLLRTVNYILDKMT